MTYSNESIVIKSAVTKGMWLFMIFNSFWIIEEASSTFFLKGIIIKVTKLNFEGPAFFGELPHHQ